jgi:hypothetical protein
MPCAALKLKARAPAGQSAVRVAATGERLTHTPGRLPPGWMRRANRCLRVEPRAQSPQLETGSLEMLTRSSPCCAGVDGCGSAPPLTPSARTCMPSVRKGRTPAIQASVLPARRLATCCADAAQCRGVVRASVARNDSRSGKALPRQRIPAFDTVYPQACPPWRWTT